MALKRNGENSTGAFKRVSFLGGHAQNSDALQNHKQKGYTQIKTHPSTPSTSIVGTSLRGQQPAPNPLDHPPAPCRCPAKAGVATGKADTHSAEPGSAQLQASHGTHAPVQGHDTHGSRAARIPNCPSPDLGSDSPLTILSEANLIIIFLASSRAMRAYQS